MTNKEALTILEKAEKCHTKNSHDGIFCDECPWDVKTDEYDEAIKVIRNALSKQSASSEQAIDTDRTTDDQCGDSMKKTDDVPNTNVGDMVSRRFVELLSEYHDPEICPYKEYKGKPYFSIKYIENGEEYIGYGTYSPKVLSQYLRDYFMVTAQPDGDISQQAVTESDLIDWYINSVDESEPVWTEEHIYELFNDFYLIPKENR